MGKLNKIKIIKMFLEHDIISLDLVMELHSSSKNATRMILADMTKRGILIKLHGYTYLLNTKPLIKMAVQFYEEFNL